MLTTACACFLLAMSAHGHVSLYAENKVVRPGVPFPVLVSISLDKGWHTYWQNPGDAGIPPKIRWRLPSGWTAGPVLWQTPKQLLSPDVVSYGYEGKANLIVWLTPRATPLRAAGGSASKQQGLTHATISAHVDWLVCREGCIATHGDVSKTLMLGTRPQIDPAAAALISPLLASLPKPSGKDKLLAYRHGNELFLTVKGDTFKDSTDQYFYCADPTVEPSAPQVFQPSEHASMLKLKVSSYAPSPVARLRGLLTFHLGAEPITQSVDIPVIQEKP